MRWTIGGGAGLVFGTLTFVMVKSLQSLDGGILEEGSRNSCRGSVVKWGLEVQRNRFLSVSILIRRTLWIQVCSLSGSG
jgi:hypothetical protein